MKKSVIILIILAIAGIGFGGVVANQFSGKEKPKAQVLSQKTTSTVAPTIAPSVKPVTRPGLPKKIRIPKIGVDGSVESVGLDAKKAMDVPKNADNAGWYQLGSRPGELGSAVFAGHLDRESGAPAIFFKLNKLVAGDQIFITDDKGEEYTFTVTRMAKYPYDQFPIGEVFGKSSGSSLNLITCQGNWDGSARNYSHRFVVYSELTK